MNKALITEQHLHDIADAIIAKGGATAPMTPAQMPGAIANIPSGGGEPAWPQPWKNDGKTHLWFYFGERSYKLAYFSAQFISDGHTFSIDWGDGTVDTVAQSSTFTTRGLSHVYSNPGYYEVVVFGYDTIKLTGNHFGTYNSDYGSSILAIRQVEFGGNVDPSYTISGYGHSIAFIKFPDGFLTTLGDSVFARCLSLVSVFGLSSVTTMVNNAFYNCHSLYEIEDMPNLTSVAYPFNGVNGLVKIGNLSSLVNINGFLSSKPNLISIGDLSSVETLPDSVFAYNSSLRSIGDMSSLTTVIGNAFYKCNSISSLTFRSKTHTEVQSITGFDRFPNRGVDCIFHCSDGDFYRSGNSLLPIGG